MTASVLIALYCALILIASLAGGLIPHLFTLTHTRLQTATSFVAGLMLGVGVLHLLPHSYTELGSIDRAASWLLAGFLVMFFIQRFFHFHHHDVPGDNVEKKSKPVEEELSPHDHAHQCEHHQHADHDPGFTLADKSALKLTWTGAALGLTLHTLIDGVALAASVQVESQHASTPWLVGFGTFLVIILHKPFDAMAIATLMAAGGWSKASRHWVNGLFAMAIPAGILLFYLGAGQIGDEGYLGCALAFAAGTFLCIAASDLLPELQFHSHDRGKLSVALICGLLLSIAIGAVESSGHDHHHDHNHEDHKTEQRAAEQGG